MDAISSILVIKVFHSADEPRTDRVVRGFLSSQPV